MNGDSVQVGAGMARRALLVNDNLGLIPACGCARVTISVEGQS
jgi:hypothetical protein